MESSLAQILFALSLSAAIFQNEFQFIGPRFFYIEKNTTLDWFDAARTCRRMGGELATIQSQQELHEIVPNLEWDSKYWLSLNDLGQEGSFISLSSGQPAPFLNWRKGQPDNYNFNQHCVAVINYYMYDSDCDSKALFICEAKQTVNNSK